MIRFTAIFAMLLALSTLSCSDDPVASPVLLPAGSTTAESQDSAQMEPDEDPSIAKELDKLRPETLYLEVRPVDPPEDNFDIYYRYIAGNFSIGEISYIGQPKKFRRKRGKKIILKETIPFKVAHKTEKRVILYSEGYEPQIVTFASFTNRMSVKLLPFTSVRVTPRIRSRKDEKNSVNVMMRLMRYSDQQIADARRLVVEEDALQLDGEIPMHLRFSGEKIFEDEHLKAITTTGGKRVEFTNLLYGITVPVLAFANGFSSKQKKIKLDKRVANLRLDLNSRLGCEIRVFKQTKDGKKSPTSDFQLAYNMRENEEPVEVYPSSTNRSYLYAHSGRGKMHDIEIGGSCVDRESGKVFVLNPPHKIEVAEQRSVHEIVLHEANAYHLTGFAQKSGSPRSVIDFMDFHILVLANGMEWIINGGKEGKRSLPIYSVAPISEFKIRLRPKARKRFDPEDIKRWESKTFTFDENRNCEIELTLS